VKEFVAIARSKPGQLNYASPGTGSIGHLANELLAKQTGIKVTHVAYKGTGPAATAVLAGEVQFMMPNLTLREQFATVGVTPETGTPAQFMSFIKSEIEKWAAVAQYAGMSKQRY
jgi:tripartite-type tricarboxylate transporter receptor subunit TctC